ncbi:MAG TPA: DUF3011 domain-containing protein [Trichormus sp. M33_DOE_039]|nr:DUF3011 domain-containing protein [Trichormus sp. M33_DOE_039]
MVIRFPVITATFIVASSISTLLSFVPPASAREIITCESVNNRRDTCVVPARGPVRFVRQLSDASCRGNWGYVRNRIWVRNGCRAEFSVASSRYDRGGRYDRYNRDRRYNRW